MLAQTLDSKDLSSGCASACIFETERNSCDIANLYTTGGFLENRKATQQPLFDQMIPEKKGCDASVRPDIVVLKFNTEYPDALYRFIVNRMAIWFSSATRLKIVNEMRSSDSQTGAPSGDSFSFSVVSRLAVEESHTTPPIALLTLDQAPVWIRDDLAGLYQEEVEYRRKAIENPKQFAESVTPLASVREVKFRNDPSALRDSIASDVKAPATSAFRTFRYTRYAGDATRRGDREHCEGAE